VAIVGYAETGRSAVEPSGLTVDARTAVVLVLLMRKVSVADAAAAMGVAEAQVVGWIDRFVEAGSAGLARGGRRAVRPGDAEAHREPRSGADLRLENRALRAAVSESRERARMWRTIAEDNVGPYATLR
jgi:transposase